MIEWGISVFIIVVFFIIIIVFIGVLVIVIFGFLFLNRIDFKIGQLVFKDNENLEEVFMLNKENIEFIEEIQ